MIIPIRCFTCGKVIAGDIWRQYNEAVNGTPKTEIVKTASMSDVQTCPSGKPFGIKSDYMDSDNTVEYEILNKLGVRKMCCRRMILTHVDMIEHI